METVAFQVPKQFLNDIVSILKSGALETRNDKVILHFDSKGLRVIERSEKFVVDDSV